MDSGSSSRAGGRRRVARIAIKAIAVLGLFRAEVMDLLQQNKCFSTLHDHGILYLILLRTVARTY